MCIRFFTLILFSFFVSFSVNAQLFINEYMAENDSLFADNAGEFDDWIEIYNSNTFDVNLAGYYITDDDSIPTKFEIPFTNSSKTTVPAGGFLLFWADKQPGQGENHVDFKLSGGGERIQLYEPDGVTLVDKRKFGKQTGTISEGLNVDGGTKYIPFGEPSPGMSNGDVCAVIPPNMKFNEINYNSNLLNYTDDWVELYNDNDVAVDLSGWTFHDSGNKFTIPSGVTIGPRGYYVLAADSLFFQGIFPAVSNFVGNFEFNLSGDKEQLRIFSASGCQVERFTYEDQVPWPTEPDGFGPTLSLIDTTLDNDIPGSWASSTAGGAALGTPGMHNNIPDPCALNPDSILINEIMYNPGVGNDNEWLELYNPSNNTVNLENWEIHDEDSSYVFPAGISIGPKGYLVIAKDAALFTAAFPSVSNFEAPLSIGLSNSGENLYLYSPGRCLMDFVDYNDNFPWVTDPDGEGPSLALKDPELENDKGINWGVSTGIGTPGAPNTFTCQSTSQVYITLNGTSTLANATCPENGWIYYYDGANPDQILFAIEATPGGMSNDIQIEVKIDVTLDPQNPANFTDGIFFHEDIPNKRALFGMGRWWNVTYLPGSPQLPAATKFRYYFAYQEMGALTTAAGNWNNLNFGGALNVSLPIVFMKDSGVFDPVTDYSSTGVTNASDYTSTVFGLEDNAIYFEYENITELTGGSFAVKVNEPELIVPLKMMLEGPYKPSTGLMDDKLRQLGFIPNAQPFNTAPWNYTGTETIQPMVLDSTGNDAIVDWVLVEIRDQASPTTVLGTQAALIQRDGDIVGMDGRSHLAFKSLGDGNYQLAVKHRNHLSVMTANAVSLNFFSNPTDLTTAALYGTDPAKLVNGVQVLWTGDASPDFTINASDRSTTWNSRNQTGYLDTDCNMDGVCNASDRSITWNGRNRSAQLP